MPLASFVDSHAHLGDPAFDPDREAVIADARAAGCRGIVCIGESLASAARAESIAAAYPGFVVWTAGVHPHDAASFDADRDGAAIRGCMQRGAVAVGECGLDYHYDHSPREAQRAALGAQLDIARETAKPLVVHTREAEADMLGFIADARRAGVRGVLHCFTGGPALAEAALAAGWHVSFAGVVTFRKWDGDALVRAVPDDRILVESDAPYLAPVPLRGKRNEPAYVANTLEHVARVRGQDVETLGALVVANAVRCFGLVLAPAAV